MDYRKLGWSDYLKHLYNKGTAPVEKSYAPTMKPHLDPTVFKGGGGQFNGSGASATVQRPVAPAVEPNAPAVTQGVQASANAAPAPVPMRVPANRAATPSLRDNPGNLRGVNDVDPKVDHWKAFREKAAQMLLTPGYHDKKRGIWVSPATAVYEKEQKQAQTNKTRDFLVRKGYSLEDADAIVSNPSVSKEVLATVARPAGFKGEKETTFDREIAKDAAEWGAKKEDVVNDIKALDEATKYLEDQVNNPDYINTDTTLSNLYRTFTPENIQTQFSSGRDLKSNRDLVYSITAKNLKLILGGQFAEKEGRDLLARTYDTKLLPEENLRRVRRLQESMKRAYIAKERLYARTDLTDEQKKRSMDAIRQQVLDENPETSGKETSGGFTYLGTE
jgi:hypothetical protein